MIDYIIDILNNKFSKIKLTIVEEFSIKNLMNSYTFIAMVIITQFKPQGIIGFAEYYPNMFTGFIDVSWTILQIIMFLTLIFISLHNFEFTKFNFIYFASVLIITVVSILNSAPLSRIASNVVSPLALVLLIEQVRKSSSMHRLAKVIFIYFGSLILLNFILVFLFPNSLYIDYRERGVNWLFGNYQQNFNWYVVFIAFSRYTVSLSENRIKKILNTIVIIVIVSLVLTTLRVWSATTLAALFVTFLSLGISIVFSKFANPVNLLNSYITGIFATFCFAFLKIQEVFSFIIEGILNKSLTFSGRSKFWDNTIRYFKMKPIFGHGIETSNKTFSKIGKATSHNHYLNLLYNGGLVYFILNVWLVIEVYNQIKSKLKNPNIYYFSAALSGYFIYFIAEAKINLNVFVLLLSFVYYIAQSDLEFNSDKS